MKQVNFQEPGTQYFESLYYLHLLHIVSRSAKSGGGTKYHVCVSGCVCGSLRCNVTRASSTRQRRGGGSNHIHELCYNTMNQEILYLPQLIPLLHGIPSLGTE